VRGWNNNVAAPLSGCWVAELGALGVTTRMKLSASQKELVARVRRSRDLWRRRRWALLLLSASVTIVSLAGWVIQVSKLYDPETFPNAIFLQTIFLVVAVAFGSSVGSVISRWESPAQDLLLSLTDSQEDHET
jgi:hypothetical protein